jgi:hypothetical protein
MRFMNSIEVSEARYRFREHATLGPASRTLLNLMDAADANSDGWAYWPKPARSAAKLMELLSAALSPRYEGNGPTAAEVRKAYAPIKAFRTRSGISFDIVDV